MCTMSQGQIKPDEKLIRNVAAAAAAVATTDYDYEKNNEKIYNKNGKINEEKLKKLAGFIVL